MFYDVLLFQSEKNASTNDLRFSGKIIILYVMDAKKRSEGRCVQTSVSNRTRTAVSMQP